MATQIEQSRFISAPQTAENNRTTERLEASFGSTSICIVPASRVVTNEDIAKKGYLTRTGQPFDAAKIFQVTGIETRRNATEDETAQYMGERAARPVVEEFGKEIAAVDFSTSYPSRDGLLPGLNHAGTLARQLGLPHDTAAHDRHMACSGFASALSSQQNREGRVLIVGSERYSDSTDGLNEAIFSDGAGAFSYMPEGLQILGSLTKSPSDFTQESNDAIRMPIDYEAIRHPATYIPIPQPQPNGEEGLGKFYMNGNAVYKLMLRHLPPSILEFMRANQLDSSDIGWIIPHQASIKVLEDVRDLLPEALRENFYINVREGNFSSVSIMKAMAELMSDRQIKAGKVVVGVGFGAGLDIEIVGMRFGKN